MPTPCEIFTTNDANFFRSYQKQCYDNLHTAKAKGEKRCLSLMFCGTGKTRVFYTFMSHQYECFRLFALPEQFDRLNFQFIGK